MANFVSNSKFRYHDNKGRSVNTVVIYILTGRRRK